MAVTSTPVAGRIRFTYPGMSPDLRISGMNPQATAGQLASLTAAIQTLQIAPINNVLFTVESDLQEA
ncbi:MAG: hypothetical protein FWC91_14430 [Defluviitaleaceae bacterium]|nr:hypothetical protein [Defluviitaleaceae bacterium]